MGSRPEQFTVELTVASDEPYKTAELRGKHTVKSDEPEWIPHGAGDDEHPAPVDYLVLSLAACQASVLEQCLEKNGVEEYRVDCHAVIDGYGSADEVPEEMPENAATRIEHVTVEMTVETIPEYRDTVDRCLTVYDDGCIVGQSLAGGIDYTPLTSLEVTESIP